MNFLINTFMSKAKRIVINEDGTTEEVEVLVQYLSLKEYNKIQTEWIEKHKYFLSQKEGYDVGFNAAAMSWVKTGLADYFRKLFKIKTKGNK
jgi:hypothetical protein